MKFESKCLPDKYDYLAPDLSEIRLLLSVNGGGMAHCTLPVGKTSIAQTHKTVEEIWYIIRGRGKVWRKRDDEEEIVDVAPGMCITIPLGTHFQFQNIGNNPLSFIISTMPPWPGKDEAICVRGRLE